MQVSYKQTKVGVGSSPWIDARGYKKLWFQGYNATDTGAAYYIEGTSVVGQMFDDGLLNTPVDATAVTLTSATSNPGLWTNVSAIEIACDFVRVRFANNTVLSTAVITLQD